MNIIDKLTNELLEKNLVIHYDENLYYITNGVQQLSFTEERLINLLKLNGIRSFVNTTRHDLNLMSRC